MGYKLARFREQFNVNILDTDFNLCKQPVKPVIFQRRKTVNCLHTLIDVNC